MGNILDEKKISVWKQFEKLIGIVGFLAGVAALIGLYYQIQNKTNQIEFQIISKDYLTLNNNIDGLKSNYEYGGISVKNLWLIKLKIINSGDVTLIGKGEAKNILDSCINFNFDSNLQILDKIVLVQKNLPDHRLSRKDSITLSLSFEQWRKDEFAIYSIYIKSDKSDISLLPTAKRILNDGNIFIKDLSSNQEKNKRPLLDNLLSPPLPLICRILGVLMATLIFSFLSYIIIFEEFKSWGKILRWRNKYYKDFKEFLLNYDSSVLTDYYKNDFLKYRSKYIDNPSSLSQSSEVWKKFKGEQFPVYYNAITTWKDFWLFSLLLISVDTASISIILGLWVQ